MVVIWHDLECGSYTADIPLWLELAGSVEGPILEVGAGTGRVALELAYAGHQVHALERDPRLADELRRRGRGLGLRVICADAQTFASGVRYELVIAAMQTVHLMDSPGAFLRCVRRAMTPGGRLAAALIGEDVTPFREVLDADEAWIDGVHYASCPSGLWLDADGAVSLERRREADGKLVEVDVTRLHPLDSFAPEAERCGFALREPARHVAPTESHAGSEVMILHAV